MNKLSTGLFPTRLFEYSDVYPLLAHHDKEDIVRYVHDEPKFSSSIASSPSGAIISEHSYDPAHEQRTFREMGDMLRSYIADGDMESAYQTLDRASRVRDKLNGVPMMRVTDITIPEDAKFNNINPGMKPVTKPAVPSSRNTQHSPPPRNLGTAFNHRVGSIKNAGVNKLLPMQKTAIAPLLLAAGGLGAVALSSIIAPLINYKIQKRIVRVGNEEAIRNIRKEDEEADKQEKRTGVNKLLHTKLD